MADKLGEAFVDLIIKDAKFNQSLRQQQQRAAAAAALIGTKMSTAFGNKTIASIDAATAAIRRQERVANAAAAAMSRGIASNSFMQTSRARNVMKDATFAQSRSHVRVKFSQDMEYMKQKANIRLALNDSAFRQKMEQNKKEMEQLNSAASGEEGLGIGDLVGAGLILEGIESASDTLKGMVSTAFEYNSALEKSTVSLGVLLGSKSSATSLMSELQEFAAKTPFELPTLNQATVSLLATKKIAQSQVLPILQKLGDAAAGSSEGFDSMPRITRAVAQMLTKGKIQAEEMMQLSEAGVPAWTALAEKMGKSTAEVQEMGEKGKLGIKEIMLLVDGLGDTYQGLAEEQSQTFDGLSSTIKDNVGKALGDAFKPLYDFATRGMRPLVAFLDSPEFLNSTKIFSKGLQASIAFAEKLVNHPLAKSVATFAAMTAGALTLASAVSLVGPMIATAISLAPLVAFSAALGYVASLLYEAFAGDTGAEFVGMLRESWGLVKEIAFQVDAMLPSFSGLVQMLGGAFGSSGTIQQGVNSFIRGTLDGLRSILDFTSILTNDMEATWELAKTSGDLAVSYLGDRFLYLFNTQVPAVIAGMFDGMIASGGVLVNKWKTLFEAMFEAVGHLINGMIDAQKAKIDGIVAGLQAVRSGRLGDAMAEVAKGFANAEMISGKAKIDAAKSFTDKAGPVLKTAFEEFNKAFRNTTQAMPAFQQSDATKSLAESVRSQFAAMRAERDRMRNERFSVTDGVMRAFAGIGGAGSTFGNVMADVFGQVGQSAMEAKPVADLMGEGRKIFDFFTPPEAKQQKDVKSEFVGLTEMNKRIQGQLGKAKEDADKKKALKLSEEQKKGIDEVVKKGEATVGVLKDIASKLGLK